jgi:hypothetical protein
MEDQNWHQLRLHGLEAAASALAGAHRFGHAVGRRAGGGFDADPLRESPNAVLTTMHMREGNQSEALCEFERYRSRLDAALGSSRPRG